MSRLPLGPSSRLRSRLFVSRLAGANGSKSAVWATRVFSSSIFDGDDDTGAGAGTSRDSAAVLRAIRNGEDVAAVTADDGIDYRYRSVSKSHHDASVDSFRGKKPPLDLWEETAARTEQERQRQNDAKSRNPVPSLSSIYDQDMDGRRMSARKRGGPNGKGGKNKFISFFDEVDELIEKRRAEKIGTTRSKNGGAMGSSLANLLDKLENYPDVGRLDDDRSSSVGYGHSSRLSDDFVGSNSISTSSKATSTFSHEYDDNLAPSANRARSIFDTDDDIDFEPEPVNPHAYDKETFEQYETLLREELENQKFVQMRIRSMKDATEEEKQEYLRPVYKWLLTHERTVSYDLPTLRQASENPETVFSTGELDGQGGSQGDCFRGELEKQQQAFLEETGLSPEQYQVAKKAFQVLATQCAKRARAAPVEIMWEKIKESGMILSANVMSTILYVVSTGGSVLSSSSSFSSRDNERQGGKLSSISSLFSGISGRNDSAGANKDNEEDEGTDKTEEEDSVNVQDEVAFFHDMLYEPTDNSTSLRVKGLISKGDAEGAERLLEAFASREGTVVRLRSYLPILNLYCQKGEISSAMRLFKRMRNTESVHLEPENYVMVISALAENGCFREDAEPIENATELGYSEPCGLALFDELVTEMTEEVLEITSASARKMYNSLAIGFKDQRAGRNLQEMHSLAGMRVFNDPSEDDEVVASRISVDHETGMCPRTKAKLRLVMLDDGQRKQLRQSLSQLAASETAKFAKGNNRKQKEDAQRAIEEMTRFGDWLDTRTGEPFTAIVDGANAAYYMQNFDQGSFNFYQIQFVVDALIKMKENPLVVLPYKYGFDSFKINTGFAGELQRLSDEERNIRDSLVERGMLYRVPPRLLDDYYWMIASVSDQIASRKGANIDVSPQNEDGRWPGTRPMLVSNDQMRDHKLEMLEPRLFRRWYSSHIVNYNFTAFVGNECVDRSIGFSTPDFFSREIQGNPSPNGGMAWHFPVSDWDIDDRFVVRIPSTRNS